MFNFLYNFLFVDQKSKLISHTKFFSVIGYIILCVMFPYAVLMGSKVDYMFWGLFGAVVVGNRSLNKAIANKDKKDGSE